MSFIPDEKPYEGGWVGESAFCVRANNPSPMTHTGTNTWILTRYATGKCLVVDPAPAGQHVENVLATCKRLGLEVAAIAVTHHHFDHTEGVVQLARATGAPVFAPSSELLRRFAAGDSCAPGTLDAAEAAGTLADGGNMLEWPGEQPGEQRSGASACNAAAEPVNPAARPASPASPANPNPRYSLFRPFAGAPDMLVVPLPGHSSDSVGILLERERLLLTGDTLFRHGPTVVFHPDGQLGPYLQSLDVLERMVRQGKVACFLPAHGWPIEDPLRIIAATRDHRLERLHQIQEALAKGTPANPDALFDVVYQDVDPRLRPASIRSIQAQLTYLGL